MRYVGKKFSQRRPDGKGGWTYNLKGIERPPLYHLPEVLEAVSQGKAIYICEGEKDADNLRAKGKIATCGHLGAGGSNKWLSHYGDYLRGSDVIIIPDNDKIGKSFGAEIAQKLLGVAKSIRLVDLTEIVPALPEHGDISDILSMSDIDGVAELDKLSKATPHFMPPELPDVKENAAKATLAEKVLQLVESSGAIFFHDEVKELYASVPISNHKETLPINGIEFNRWLTGLYYNNIKKPVSNEAVSQVLATLSAKALYDSNEPVKLYIRTAGLENGFWYDLTNNDWQAVHITQEGWQVEAPPALFIRYRHQAVQATPIHGGDMTKILKYVPIKENPLLFYCWLVSAFVPDFPHAMPIFYGEKGAAKTTTCEFLKSLIDPSMLKTIILQNDQRTLAVNFQQHWFIPFDNVSNINDDTSNILCQAVTGGYIQQRKLCTNTEDSIFTFQRVIAINGINNVVTRSDLLDRAILVELRRIAEDERRELSALRQDFENDKAVILGGIFDTLVDAMKIYPTVKLNRLFRMADFTHWGYAIGEALSKGGGEQFLKEYAANYTIQNAEAIASDPLATLMVAFMDDRQKWKGTATNLYKALKSIAVDHGISTRDRAFPKDPPRLSRHMNGIRSNLEAMGITIYDSRIGSERTLTIVKH